MPELQGKGKAKVLRNSHLHRLSKLRVDKSQNKRGYERHKKPKRPKRPKYVQCKDTRVKRKDTTIKFVGKVGGCTQLKAQKLISKCKQFRQRNGLGVCKICGSSVVSKADPSFCVEHMKHKWLVANSIPAVGVFKGKS